MFAPVTSPLFLESPAYTERTDQKRKLKERERGASFRADVADKIYRGGECPRERSWS